MDKATLDLTLCQLIKVFDSSKKNYQAYSDPRKHAFHKAIEQLLEEIKSIDLSGLKAPDIQLHKELFENLFIWIEFLDNSTLNNIPYEIVRCLDAVLQDWLTKENFEKYVIVTSLQSQLLSFSYWDPELDSQLAAYVEHRYKTKINNTLVPINLPKHLAHDYLANVTLYHEIGHFIDRHYKITRRIVSDNILFKAMKPAQKLERLYHLSEHFADIFAAQYIDDKCSTYLDYIAHGYPDCDTHPATQRRVDFVRAFLDGKDDVYIKMLKDATSRITKIELRPGRYKKLLINDFESFLPAECDNTEQLHYLFIQGWDSWYNTLGNIASTFSISIDRHRVINNLIEKSISNFIVKEKWKQYVPN
jgi:hypothetical protein